MNNKQKLEDILNSEISTMQKLIAKGTEIDVPSILQTHQKIYELLTRGTFLNVSTEAPETPDTVNNINNNQHQEHQKVTDPKFKIIKRFTESKPTNTFKSKYDEINANPDVIDQGFFKQSIKGGYVHGRFVPEKLVRRYNLKHDDWAVIYGNDVIFKDIQIINPPIEEFTSEFHKTQSKLHTFKYALVETSKFGKLIIKRNLDGEKLNGISSIDVYEIDASKLDVNVKSGDVVDIRFDKTQQYPSPRIVWVYDYDEVPKLRENPRNTRNNDSEGY